MVSLQSSVNLHNWNTLEDHWTATGRPLEAHWKHTGYQNSYSSGILEYTGVSIPGTLDCHWITTELPLAQGKGCDDVSHWLGASLESALYWFFQRRLVHQLSVLDVYSCKRVTVVKLNRLAPQFHKSSPMTRYWSMWSNSRGITRAHISNRSSTTKANWPCIPGLCVSRSTLALWWRHNERDSVSNYQRFDCLLNRLFRCRSKRASNLRVTGLCVGNSPGTGEFTAQRASNAKNATIWWRHHGLHHNNW